MREAGRHLAMAALLALATGLAHATGPTARELELQFRRGEAPLAMKRLDLALAERPVDAELRFLKGVLLGETGQTAEAAQWFERMTQEFPELPEPHNNLAVLRAGAGQLDAARVLLETALRLAPDYRTARENLGDVFVRLAARAYAAAADGVNAEPLLLRKLALSRELTLLR
jgi:Flp pilus assembly protein TadD